MSDLSETDILGWCERRRDLLGREQLRTVESLPAQATTHILKTQAWLYAREVP
ncbi:MAG: hypothetical protein P4L99_00570 [Chthoniobacter sp.]|nr:hypothetical protein [Chthoniobacter sp.]